MDRRILEEHLALARRHANMGAQHIARQEGLIAELDRDGHDTAEARKILNTLRETQRLHEQDVERLLLEVSKSLP
ncbi:MULTISPECIES: hypothetical protein [Bradyrhizobium]|uniref:hypothetical protein n=1 Tax=Bradyrhizobium TaxID=374 RepID=UPI0004853379|nr:MULTISPECIES: hypothetical protein [Bradyrhizobium]UFW46500.1 hypothetical protein BaraCB756_29930 [Bradyrhizobium arachidis]